MQSSARLDDADRIVGGADAPTPIPWQVSIRSWGGHFCGGTILDSKTILSAGHCFDKDKDYGKAITILAGVNDRTKGEQVCIAPKTGFDIMY